MQLGTIVATGIDRQTTLEMCTPNRIVSQEMLVTMSDKVPGSFPTFD